MFKNFLKMKTKIFGTENKYERKLWYDNFQFWQTYFVKYTQSLKTQWDTHQVRVYRE